MAAGFGVLRLSPDALWRMTPREMAAALSVLEGRGSRCAQPPSRGDLDTMMKRFPDR